METIEISNIDKYSDKAIQMLMEYGPKMILALIVLFVGLQVINGFVKLLSKGFEKKE
tara:strand:+ start:4892 stop:5062 length:171 start_codon:yes stop_codon:yes gene_type:complete